MQPKTKLQHKVVELSSKLSPITEKQSKWAVDNCVEKFVVRSRNTLFCLECGCSWKDTSCLVSALVGSFCPECKSDLRELDSHTYKRGYTDMTYFSIITTKGGFQVERVFSVEKTMKKSQAHSIYIQEVMQHWVGEDGNVTSLSKDVQTLSRFYDLWISSSDLEVRPKQFQSSPRYSIIPDKIYPVRQILSVMKRNGFKGHFHGFSPHKLFSKLLTDSIFETLIKSAQQELFKQYFTYCSRIEKYWSSIKIAIRNDYAITNVSNYFDYLNLIEFFGKDLHNPKYVCPKNIKFEHDRLVKKKREMQKREELEAKRKKAAKWEQQFLQQKAHLLGIVINDDKLIIKTLDSVQEYMEEGDALHHCVYTNEYFLKSESLCLSARIEGKPIETIELSLKEMKVVQSRGLNNKLTSEHNKIMRLVESNIDLIRKRVKLKTA